jgi:hypothetical protein
MRTQSIDTTADAERMMIHLIRQASMSKRFRLVQSLTQSTMWSNFHSWQQNHPGAREDEAAFHFVSCFYGTHLAQQVQATIQQGLYWHMQPPDLISIIQPALSIFEKEGIPYYLGGSIASSLHGMLQAAHDVDLIIDLPEHSRSDVFTSLRQFYLFETQEALQAAGNYTSFPCIHLDSLLKIDLIFPKVDVFHTSMRQYVASYTLDERYAPICIASASGMILFKLHRYQHHAHTRQDRMQDDAEWNDILGMLKVQGHNLDSALLSEWANELDVIDIWQEALVDAGLIEVSNEKTRRV